MVIIYFALYDKCGLGKPSKWYIDLAAQVTIHNSDSVLKHEFHPTNFTSFSNTTSLSPCDQFDVSIGDEYTTSLIFSIVLYASSKSWDKFATRAYTLYSDMGDDTESECPSADEELFTSTSSSNTITTPNLAHVTDDKQVKNQSTTANPGAQTSAKKPYKGKNLPIPEATQILTGYKEADDQQEQVRDIIVYDIPYTWDVEKILGELTLWGHTIKLSTCGASAFKIIQTSQGKRKLVGYFENWETTLKALDTPQVFLNDRQSSNSNQPMKKDKKSSTKTANDDNQLKNSEILKE
ncbi:hypothetical protein RhiirA1_445058 [Rhizophagus irregularis]|uniref:Uncharacterized protein n=1 Tax=Rhizophagus irregularis TaxID=588596 RepID=A0A2N0RA68_9GLOM|nr:hypothetical protein RhiirA1_445058 [Rhizophagus irregularis]